MRGRSRSRAPSGEVARRRIARGILAIALTFATRAHTEIARGDGGAASASQVAIDASDATLEDLVARAQAAERAHDFERAIRQYNAIATRFSATREARDAVARSDYLKTHAEGEFGPLRRLESIRNDAGRADDRNELRALALDAANFPRGAVRSEARLLVAEAYAGRLRQPSMASELLAAVADDDAAEPRMRTRATDLLARLTADTDGPREALRVAHARASFASIGLVSELRRLVRREYAVGGARLIAMLFFALSMRAVWRIRARRIALSRVRDVVAPALLMAGSIGGIGAALATLLEADATPFILLAAALVPTTLLARVWSLNNASTPSRRIARAIVSALAVLSISLLVLAWTDAAYLQSFGL